MNAFLYLFIIFLLYPLGRIHDIFFIGFFDLLPLKATLTLHEHLFPLNRLWPWTINPVPSLLSFAQLSALSTLLP